jgi:3-oxoadipate enol-lactonase
MADDIAGLLDKLDISKTHVCGGSMGGAIAQELALNHKEKVTSLILFSTYCGGKKSVYSAEVKEIFWDNLFKGRFPDMSQKELLEFTLKLAYTPNYLKTHRDEIYKNISALKYPTPAETWVRHGQATADFDAYDRLPEISVPTLLLHGGDDIFVPPINTRIIQWRINGSKRVVLENVGHNLHIEAREKFVTLMLDFMKNVDG